MIAAERISLRRVSPTLGFADVRLAAVHLRGLRVEQTPSGRITVKPPEQRDSQGRAWPLYALQPGTREQVEAELCAMWARSGGGR